MYYVKWRRKSGEARYGLMPADNGDGTSTVEDAIWPVAHTVQCVAKVRERGGYLNAV